MVQIKVVKDPGCVGWVAAVWFFRELLVSCFNASALLQGASFLACFFQGLGSLPAQNGPVVFGQGWSGMQGAEQAQVPLCRGRAGECELAKWKEHRAEQRAGVPRQLWEAL